MEISIERLLELYSVIEMEDVVDKFKVIEDWVELEAVWVVIGCVDGCVKDCFVFILLDPSDKGYNLRAVQLHLSLTPSRFFQCIASAHTLL